MTKKEWNELHGYDESGKPKQAYVWEGVGDGPPPRNNEDNNRWTWLVNKSGRGVVASLHVDDVWIADGITGPAYKNQSTPIAHKDTPYAEVIKKAYTMYMLHNGR